MALAYGYRIDNANMYTDEFDHHTHIEIDWKEMYFPTYKIICSCGYERRASSFSCGADAYAKAKEIKKRHMSEAWIEHCNNSCLLVYPDM